MILYTYVVLFVVHQLECTTLCKLVQSIQYLATRMANGTIYKLDPQKESTEDFEGDNHKKALFLTLLGQGSFRN